MKVKNVLLQRKWSISVIIILLFIIFDLYSDRESIRFSCYTVPNVELGYDLSKSSSLGKFHGTISGFVKFDDEFKQPKEDGWRQYYIITATNRLDKNRNQIFSVEEIMDNYHIAPKSIGINDYFEVGQISRKLILESQDGHRIYINTISKDVTLDDEKVILLTDQSEYKKFIQKFLSIY